MAGTRMVKAELRLLNTLSEQDRLVSGYDIVSGDAETGLSIARTQDGRGWGVYHSVIGGRFGFPLRTRSDAKEMAEKILEIAMKYTDFHESNPEIILSEEDTYSIMRISRDCWTKSWGFGGAKP